MPFTGENFVAVAMQHINEPPPPVRDERPDVPPRARRGGRSRRWRRGPRDRFATMADFGRRARGVPRRAAGRRGTQAAPAVARPRQTPRRSGVSPWPLILVVCALIAIGAVIAFFVLHHKGSTPSKSGGSTTGGGTPGAVHIKGVARRPVGDHHEHNERVGLATDASSSTYWETETYDNAPSLGKPGVGPRARRGQERQAQPARVRDRHARVHGPGPGGRLGERAVPDVVGASQVAGGQTRYTITGSPHEYYEIWITRLGPGYRDAHINTVSAN